MKRKLLITISITSILGLTACGQTGALYLPDEKNASSGSTIATSGSSMMNKSKQKSSSSSNSDDKIDNDPNTPPRYANPTLAEGYEGETNFTYNNNIQDSAQAGGMPLV
ncbi:LPS translocon maturation chaperone LptM [Francisella sp. XLW-1]|uniref:LPS translocon maturation chaperone LptM n=1 Tax=Francisella sp. XLW-1 TaxID=2610887 RepID=UPI00123D67D5|nr:lipoprotein [Francisella sp. XLW-1]